MLISEKVMELRKTNPLSNNALEKEIGIPKGSFDHWGKKDYQPSLSAIIKIATYFNVTTDYLLGLTDEPQQTNSTPDKEDKLVNLLKEYIVANNLQINDKGELEVALAPALKNLNDSKK